MTFAASSFEGGCQLVENVPLEVWNGQEWLLYSEVDAVLRYGLRLTEAQAMALLHGARARIVPLPRLSDTEARIALRAGRRLS